MGSVLAARGLQLLHSMWDLSRSKIEPVSPTLTGRFLSAVLPRKSQKIFSD